MKAVVVPHPEAQLEIWEVADPKISDYDVLVEMLACGVCASTDSELISGHFPGIDHYPTVLGHEGVGRVIDKGAKVRNLSIGDLVIRPGLQKVGDDGRIGSAWGAFAEFGVATDGRAMREDAHPEVNDFYLAQQTIPRDMDPVLGTMLVTLKETYSGLQQFGVGPRSSVLIFGDGPVGACLTRFAKLMGAGPVIVVGHHDSRLSFASRLGANAVVNSSSGDVSAAVREAAPGGIDFVIDAVGRNELINQGLTMIKNHGKVCIYGVSPSQRLDFDWSRGPRHWTIEHLIFPTFTLESATHEVILDWIRLGLIDLKPMVTHVLPLEDIREAFELVWRREAFKVVIRIKA